MSNLNDAITATEIIRQTVRNDMLIARLLGLVFLLSALFYPPDLDRVILGLIGGALILLTVNEARFKPIATGLACLMAVAALVKAILEYGGYSL